MRLSLLLFITLFFELIIHSQHFKIKNIDNQSFPTIKLVVELNDKSNINELKLIENGQERPFKIDSTTVEESSGAVCYLIDVNKFNKAEKQIVFNALFETVKKLKSGSLINICFVATKNEDNCLIPLSYEFSDSPLKFVQFAENMILQTAQNPMSENLNCALKSTISFVYEKNNLPDQKTIILLTNNIKNSTDVSNIIEAGKNSYNIDVKLISNVHDSLLIKQNDFYYLQTEFSKQELFDKLFKASIEKDLTNINRHRYILEFVSIQNGFLNSFEIHFKDKFIKKTFINPNKKPAIDKIWWITGIFSIVFLILLLIIVTLIYSKQKMAGAIQKLKETGSSSLDWENKEFVHTKLINDKNIFVGKSELMPGIEIKIDHNKINYKLKKLVTTIGRKKDCDVVIKNLTISGHHASITNEGGEFYIQDHKSTNGVFVNDIKVNKKTIKNGDIIRLGKAILMIHY